MATSKAPLALAAACAGILGGCATDPYYDRYAYESSYYNAPAQSRYYDPAAPRYYDPPVYRYYDYGPAYYPGYYVAPSIGFSFGYSSGSRYWHHHR